MRIFISYGHDQHAALVNRVQRDLQQQGHETWFDAKDIEHGDDWRRRITDGLHRTDAVLAFLSHHSIRDPGVCRDELDIAVSVPSVCIQTLLLEPIAPAVLPASITHIQLFDWSDWRAQNEHPETFEHWYRDHFDALLRKLAQNPEFRAEIDWLEPRLRPLSAAIRMQELLANGFVGRQWLLQHVERWRAQGRSQLLCITGEPGIGKSALAAWIARTRTTQVIAIHFCQHSLPESREPRRIVCSLAFQMARRLLDFRKMLLRAVEKIEQQSPGGLDALQPAQAFMRLLAEPAYACIDGGRARQLVVIDGLDESLPQVSEFLAEHHTALPSWLGIIVTSRPNEPLVQQHLQALDQIELSGTDGAQQQADARAYVSQWLATRPELDRSRRRILADAFSRASGGNFLYLQVLRQLSERGPLPVIDGGSPAGLARMLHLWFTRQFPDHGDYSKYQRPLLQLLCASSLPLPLELARAVLAVSDQYLRDSVLAPLGSLFRVEDEELVPYHPAVRDWLQNKLAAGRFYVSPTDARTILARALWRRLEPRRGKPPTRDAFLAQELPRQLLSSGYDLQCELLDDPLQWPRWRAPMQAMAEACEQVELTDAAEGWRRLIALYDERLCEPATLQVAANLHALAALFGQRSAWRAALAPLQQALQLHESLDAFTGAEAANCFNTLGRALLELQQTEPAREAFMHALQIARQLPADERYRLIAIYLHNLGAAWSDSDPMRAREHLQLALDLARWVHGDEHPAVIASLNDLAYVVAQSGELPGAAALFERARQLALLPELTTLLDSELRGSVWQGSAEVALAMAQPLQACEYWRTLLDWRREQRGPDDLSVAKVERQLADVSVEVGDFDGAVALLEHVLAVCRLTYGDHHDITANNLRTLAELHQRRAALPEAMRLYCELLADARQRYGIPSPQDDIEDANGLPIMLVLARGHAPLRRRVRAAWEFWEPSLHVDGQISQAGGAVVTDLIALCGSRATTLSLLDEQLQDLQQTLGVEHAATLVCQRLRNACSPTPPAN